MPISLMIGAYCCNRDKSVVLRSFACMSCGLASWNGHNFCPNCGADTSLAAIVCVKFGVLYKDKVIRGVGEADVSGGPKSKIALVPQEIFPGRLVTHKFYLGLKLAEFVFLPTNMIKFILKMWMLFFPNFTLNVIAPTEEDHLSHEK